MYESVSSAEDTDDGKRSYFYENASNGDDDEESVEMLLHSIVQKFKDKETLPNLATELVEERRMNTMVIDLYGYEKGFEVSFWNYDRNEEKWHGIYSYAVSVLEYIRSGQIPYEIFNEICNYEYEIFYDGFVACKLRIHDEDNIRSHVVLLRHSIQTIDAECLMNCKANKGLDFNSEKARLIEHYSPDLCLKPDIAVADVVFANELNRHPFLTYDLKGIVLEEKSRLEKGVQLMNKNKPQESVKINQKVDDFDWSFRLKDPTPQEVKLAEAASQMICKDSIRIETYLKVRPICFPDSFTGFHVETENFVYTYDRQTSDGKIKSVTDKFCISVLDNREIYYGAYQLDEKKERVKQKPPYWSEIGGREELDFYLNAFTKEELKSSYGRMKITHNRMFDEEVKEDVGSVIIIRKKLLVPESKVILQYSPPTSDSEDTQVEEEMNG